MMSAHFSRIYETDLTLSSLAGIGGVTSEGSELESQIAMTGMLIFLASFTAILSRVGLTTMIAAGSSDIFLIPDIVKMGKTIEQHDLLKDRTGVISLGYGKRILVNANHVDLGDLKREDILEIVDYNPVKKIVLAIGQKEPCIETSVHWHRGMLWHYN